MATFLLAFVMGAAVLWALLYMRAQRPVTTVQELIHRGELIPALASADAALARAPRDTALHLHRAEAAKLLGRFDDAIDSYRRILSIDPRDAAAREGLALSLTHLRRDLPEARKLMEETIGAYPEIQEFQALSLSFILLREGHEREALRLYDDNLVLLQTRFEDDYTDPDPLLAETLYAYQQLALAAGDSTRAAELGKKIIAWAPGSVFAEWVST